MKRKFFTTLAIFASLALASCGGTPAESSAPELEWQTNNTNHWHINADGEKIDNAKHEFEEDTAQAVEATCKQEGKKVEICKVCGFVKETKINKLEHQFDDGVVTKEATCAEPGVRTYTCSLCGEKKTEEIVADHTWGEATPVAGAADEADYNLFTCTKCGAKKIEIVAKQAEGKSVLDGSLKSDSQFPDYIKLGSNGNSISYKFQYTADGSAKVYMRGVMDYWHDGNNENQARNFFSGKNSQDGNFELKVNDAAVDYSWSKDLTYEDMLPGEAQGSYSPLGDALVGNCVVKNGENTLVFKRTESYNMLIKDFVIVIG